MYAAMKRLVGRRSAQVALVCVAIACMAVMTHAQAQPVPSGESLPADLLPRDLSPWGMFMAADRLVKAVMAGLAFASVVTWTIALAKWLELAAFKTRLSKLHQAIAGARSLAEAQIRVGDASNAAALLVRAAALELEKSPDRSDREGIRERLAATIERIEATVGRQLGRGTGILGTIGATAPFVGLFGTVWGIMNSFIGISKAHTTNLAVVAPGIAEALLATALGLAAAIPAVVIYNYLARSIAGCKALFGNTSTEVLNLTSREIAQPTERRRAPVMPARMPAE
ncbi:MAG: tonB-system energizer ExbB [Xanthobacteraceae bacterium]|nr:tonB-system energizer ExbB [Xanthobacteraceae bacterium]